MGNKKPIPKVKDLQAGLFACPECDKKIPIQESGLMVKTCPECATSIFYPHRIHDFWLYLPLGSGGMGRVYRAISENGKDEYAVKILPHDKAEDQGLKDILLREGEVGKLLGEHKNLVSVYDYGDDGQEYFMASPYVHGNRLDALVKYEQHLPEKQAVGIILQLLDAEEHMVQQGYLFRDLKPENIIVEKNGTVRLFDYGLCVPLEQAETPHEAGDLEGSPFYIPPERVVGAAEGEYSEIYSLGMLLFLMLTGRTYYSEGEIADLIKKHLTASRLSSTKHHLNHCHPRMTVIIDKMIARNPNNRYPDFVTAREELEGIYKELESGKTSQLAAVTADAGERERSPGMSFKKKKLILNIAIIVFVLLLFGGGAGYYFYQQAKHRREVTEKVAKRIGVSPDINNPDLPEKEINDLIFDRAQSLYDIQKAGLKKIDVDAEKAKIMAGLKIKKHQRPAKNLAEVNELIKVGVAEYVVQNKLGQLRPFSEEKIKKQVFDELKISSIPAGKPQPLSQVKKEYKKHLDDLVRTKYPSKQLSEASMKIVERLRAYRIGEIVELKDAVGLPVKGPYKGREGNKLVIGDRKLLINDFPLAIANRFNKQVAEKKIAATTARLREQFMAKRDAYRKTLEAEGAEEKFFLSKGYRKFNGKWLKIKDFFDQKLAVARKVYQDKEYQVEKRLEGIASKQYSREMLYPKHGYRKHGKKWVSDFNLVNQLLMAKEKKLKTDRKQKLDQLKKSTKKMAEKEIFPAHGYVFYMGRWVPARPLLEKQVEIQLKRDS